MSVTELEWSFSVGTILLIILFSRMKRRGRSSGNLQDQDDYNDPVDNPTNVPVAYRELVPNVDKIAVGDEQYNYKWKSNGPWSVLLENDRSIGIVYKSGSWPIRRALKFEESVRQ
jgi:hypothetical protein